MRPAFVGVDVACAKNKRLPIVVCRWREERLIPEPLGRLDFKPPQGGGNVAACDPDAVNAFAEAAARYLKQVENHLDVRIVRMGIDAPSAPRSNGVRRRKAEVALDEAGISCFATPSEADFEAIRMKVADHLRAGGGHGNLPHANQLWMQVGFALFQKLGEFAECIEVYPQATVSVLGAGTLHKFRAGAVDQQLAAAAVYTGWPNGQSGSPRLEEIGFGPRHDRLDAYLACWVAALDDTQRVAFGEPPDDAIWVPRVKSNGQPLHLPGRSQGKNNS